jgi:hypothetical protein
MARFMTASARFKSSPPDFQADEIRNPSCGQDLYCVSGILVTPRPPEDHKVIFVAQKRRFQRESNSNDFLIDDGLQRFAGDLRKVVGLLGECVKLAFRHVLVFFLQLPELLVDAFHGRNDMPEKILQINNIFFAKRRPRVPPSFAAESR